MSEVLSFRAVRAPVHGGAMGGPWTFCVPRGAFLAVEAAPSVADTLARLCVGIEAPAEGRVEVLGEAPFELPRFRRHALRRRMGVAFQREGLVSNLTLEANLVVPLVFGSGFTPAEARVAAAGAMDDLGLAEHAHRRPGALTREARVLAALARAALRRPELLVLEHLTSALPDRLGSRALGWCRARSETMLVLVPGPSPALDRLTDGWLPPLAGRGEEGTPS